ncbi:MAG: hypothetical protein KDC32_13845, partial [Saprospiraceae bacterium]|nr:hypothetical protein [Saprospiraceae bacterium]MCB0681975.1 hypothetical protein [Saprospiraceae bacterium]
GRDPGAVSGAVRCADVMRETKPQKTHKRKEKAFCDPFVVQKAPKIVLTSLDFRSDGSKRSDCYFIQ